jgi:O6-methylguanine-DNA--protein-cysteine methyltransferase
VPCHRVIKSNGEIGGYSGSDPKNIKKKIGLLRKEGCRLKFPII